MRRFWLTAAVAFLWTGCTPTTDRTGADSALHPGGYMLRTDPRRSDPGPFAITEDEEGIRFTTGPAGIAWRPLDHVENDNFRVSATFEVFGAPLGYKEAYGIFVGGRDLGGPDQAYVYLMVRPTGDFAVLRREGGTVEALADWTSHAAVRRVENDNNHPINALTIEVRGEEGRFMVNGAVLFRIPADDLEAAGLTGVRVNHRLDVRLTGWAVGTPLPDDRAADQPSPP